MMLRLHYLLVHCCSGWLQAKSVLAMLCLGLSIAIYMQLLALEAGTQRQIAQISEATGNRNLTINAAVMQGLPNRGSTQAEAETLTLEDYAHLVQESALPLARSAAISSGGRMVEFSASVFPAMIFGTEPDYQGLLNYEVESGRFLDSTDQQSGARVAVLGSRVAEELFSERQGQVLTPNQRLGQQILIGGIPFEVIGILAARGSGQTGAPQDDSVYIPLRTALDKVFNVNYLNSIVLEVQNNVELDRIKAAVTIQLQVAHEIKPGMTADFEVLEATVAAGFVRTNNEFFGVFFRNFSLLALVLAGAGIFAVNLLQARERDSEFGLRKAVGATRADILLLMLGESLLLGILGGVGGLLLGTLTGLLVTLITGATLTVDSTVLWQALLAALGLSLTAALLPAAQAANRHPLQSLQRL